MVKIKTEEDKEFWKKFKELQDKHKEEQAKKNLGIMTEFDLAEPEEISWVNFDTYKMPDSEISIGMAKIENIMRKYNIEADVDCECLYGLINYDARFLTEIDAVLPIREIGIVYSLKRKKYQR